MITVLRTYLKRQAKNGDFNLEGGGANIRDWTEARAGLGLYGASIPRHSEKCGSQAGYTWL